MSAQDRIIITAMRSFSDSLPKEVDGYQVAPTVLEIGGMSLWPVFGVSGGVAHCYIFYLYCAATSQEGLGRSVAVEIALSYLPDMMSILAEALSDLQMGIECNYFSLNCGDMGRAVQRRRYGFSK